MFFEETVPPHVALFLIFHGPVSSLLGSYYALTLGNIYEEIRTGLKYYAFMTMPSSTVGVITFNILKSYEGNLFLSGTHESF